jgi:glycosyltransferase involved in cell wall biosynthesis
VTVVTVSYNTRELTAFLLWSLRTIVDWPDLEILVVDNGSRDGSAQLLAEAERGGVCTLIANPDNRNHGPGLNQAISRLAECPPESSPAWIWVLDSDVVVTRPDALRAALAAATAAPASRTAALIGEPQQDRWHQDGRFGLYSLLLNPAVIWQPGIGPFVDGGDPSFDLLTSAARLDVPMAAFPFAADGYLIHRGRGSLASVHASGDREHPLYTWSTDHHVAHFGEVDGAEARYRALLQEFRAATGPLTGASLVAACHAPR